MAKSTGIEWSDSTFNPFIGCAAVSPGCDNCYAKKSLPVKMMGIKWGAKEQRVRTSPANWAKPLTWNAAHEAFFAEHGHRQRVFCASLADVFDNAVDPQWREDLFTLIQRTPNLDWLLLTKRIGNAAQMIADAIEDFDIGHDPRVAAWPWENVWLGATVVNQEEADRDIPKLLAVPAAKRFLSMEPLLGPVDLVQAGALWAETGNADPMGRIINQREAADIDRDDPLIDWVIVGGESGPGARPMHPDWARSLRDQCVAAGVPFLFKQWGEFAPNWLNDDAGQKIPGSEWIDRMGKKIAGRLLDGREWNQFPEGPTP